MIPWPLARSTRTQARTHAHAHTRATRRAPRAGVTLHVPAVHARLSLPRRQPFQSHDMAPGWGAQGTAERLARAFLTMESVFGAPAAFRLWEAASQAAQ